MKAKNKFVYNGMEFVPVRKFKVYENFNYVTNRCNGGLGVHNYDKDVRKDKVSHWSWNGFYNEAKKVGAGEFDIFLMNDRVEVVPCQNELFIYVKK
jgi:hypothetical protein